MFGDLEKSRLVAYSAACIALIAVGSWISIPFFPVPLTLQTFFVLVTAVVMKRSAVIPVTLYVLLGAAGLPVFHNGIAGLGVILGPSGGYLLGFIPAALVAGYAYEYRSNVVHGIGLSIAAVIMLLSGTAWLGYSTGMVPVAALMVGFVPFIIGDAIKVSAVYLISRRLP